MAQSAQFKRTFKMQGLPELQAALNKLPDELREAALRNASAAAARVIQEEAKARVDVDTGQLRDNIVVSRSFKQRGKRVRLRGAVVIGIKGVARKYAHLVEFGWSKKAPRPFLRPALDSKAEEALQIMARQLGRELKRAAKKLGKWKYTQKLLGGGKVRRRRR